MDVLLGWCSACEPGGLGSPELLGLDATGNILIEFGLDKLDDVGEVGLEATGTGSLPGIEEELLAPEFLRIDFFTGSMFSGGLPLTDRLWMPTPIAELLRLLKDSDFFAVELLLLAILLRGDVVPFLSVWDSLLLGDM